MTIDRIFQDVIFWMSIYDLCQLGICPFFDGVISVYKGDILSCGDVYTGIPCSTQTKVGLVDDTNTTILRSPFVAYFTTSVCRTVIHENQLSVMIHLRIYTLQTLLERIFYFKDWNNNRKLHDAKIRFYFQI